MRVDVTSAFGLIMTAALIALTSLFALSVFAARTSSTKRSPSIFAEPTGSAVFLFDGPALVDATPTARAMIAEGIEGFDPWSRVLALMEPMFPALPSGLTTCSTKAASSSARARIWSRQWSCGPKAWAG